MDDQDRVYVDAIQRGVFNCGHCIEYHEGKFCGTWGEEKDPDDFCKYWMDKVYEGIIDERYGGGHG